MTKSWVSGSRSSDLIEELRREVSELEAAREDLMEENKKRVFDWSSFVLVSTIAPKELEALRAHGATAEVSDVILRYERMNQEIMEKQVRLNEKLDEQARFDSLG